ncbi:hypothetical protein evm_010705 [Chilo suppressalis]|nr:hypothetical protein evm_010705 [Chilo suppressalis]
MSRIDLPEERSVDKCNDVTVKTSDLNIDRNIIDVVNKLILKKSLSDNSSLFLVISTSDDDDNVSEHSMNPICMQVSQSTNKWKKKSAKTDDNDAKTSTNEKKQKKSKRKGWLSKSRSENGTDLVQNNLQKSLKFENEYDTTEYRIQKSITLKPDKMYHAVSVDTIRDRPCCCTPKKVNINSSQCSAMLSEILTPMMAGQGLKQEEEETYRFTRSKTIITPQNAHFIGQKQSPIKLSVCHIPPCNRPPVRLNQWPRSGIPNLQLPQFDQPGGSCHPETLLDLFDKLGKELKTTSTNCGENESCCPQPEKPIEKEIPKKTWKPEDGGEHTCKTCGRPVDGKVKCFCDGEDKLKKIRKKLCPCSHYTAPPPAPEEEQKKTDEPHGKKICKCCVCAGGKGVKGKKCFCAEKTCNPNREVKQRCDCNVEPLPETPIDYGILRELIEDNQKIEMEAGLKLKSDNTQKVSGFNVKIRKKPITEMSLDEAIKYFQLHPEEIPEPAVETEDCVCEDENAKPKMKPKPAWKVRLSLFSKNKETCECPDDEPVPEPDEFYPMPPKVHPNAPGTSAIPIKEGFPTVEELTPKGFKFSVEGKGSGSKGLKGICCFDLLQEQLFPNQSEPSSDKTE